MMLNYYLAWLHFDKYGRMATRLPEGHRVLHVLHSSSSNRYPPALWVVMEAVAAPPTYTPAAGFPVSYGEPQPQPPVEYRRPTGPQAPVSDAQFRPASWPQPQPEGPLYQEVYNKHFGDQTDGAGQNGRTEYPELSPEELDSRERDDDYRNSGGFRIGEYVPMAPAKR